MLKITTIALRGAWPGKDRWLSDGGARGAGRLLARITRDDVAFYYKYFPPKGRKRLLPMGPYDPQGTRGYTLVKARDRAAELAALYRSGIKDLHAHFAQAQVAAERERQAEEAARRQAQEEAERGTLKQLLETYVAHLRGLGKSSASDVENLFKNHVLKNGELARRKACVLSVDDFVDVLGKVVAARKGRTAGKVRSYLRAAYALALASKTDPAAPAVLKTFGIGANPLASVDALSQFNRTRHRHLSATELGGVLKRLGKLPPSPQKDALDLTLRLGGQRPAQLLRTKPADVDLEALTIQLYDRKGARTQPRLHVLPLTVKAAAIVQERLEVIEEFPQAPLFTTDMRSAMRLETLSILVREISEQMVKAREAREPFQLRDLRRTAETMLASLGTPPHLRGQVQSHGLGGVQARHYDRHDYFHEKRSVLEVWDAHLETLRLAAERLQGTLLSQAA